MNAINFIKILNKIIKINKPKKPDLNNILSAPKFFSKNKYILKILQIRKYNLLLFLIENIERAIKYY